MSIGPLPPTAGAAGEAGLHSEEALNISEATFQRIRELIVHGKLAPGSRVVEADVANRLDVSRTPVRAALHRLQQEGYIRVIAGSGSKAKLVIAPLTQEDAKELYSIVARIDGLSARAAAQVDSQTRGRLITRLLELNSRLRDLATAGRGDPNVIFTRRLSMPAGDHGCEPFMRPSNPKPKGIGASTPAPFSINSGFLWAST